MSFNLLTKDSYSAAHQFSIVSSTSILMFEVLIALVPGIITQTYLFGWGVIFNIIGCTLIALLLETIMLLFRKRSVINTITDGSVLVTAVLLALSLPTTVPWWIWIIGLFFAVIVAKHLYGGLGYNLFNPAMVGYAVLLISFPLAMSQWTTPHINAMTSNISNSLSIKSWLYHWNHVFGLNDTAHIDGYTMATPLDNLRQQLLTQTTHHLLLSLKNQAWIWINIAYAIGGIWLIIRRIIDWYTPLMMLLAMGVITLLFAWHGHMDSQQTFTLLLLQLGSGATCLGAFFILTDPVSGATTPIGRCLGAIFVGVVVMLIRFWGGYPDGIAFAILLMNTCAPLLDYPPKAFKME